MDPKPPKNHRPNYAAFILALAIIILAAFSLHQHQKLRLASAAISTSPSPQTLIEQYAPGICLIQGRYTFTDPQSSLPLLSPDDPGQPFLIPFTGTGFLIDPDGTILTSKHIAQPWLNAPQFQHILQAGYKPDLLFLRAFFPNIPNPLDLQVKTVDDHHDIAILMAPPEHCKNTAILPCDLQRIPVRPGQNVLLIGYHTGLTLLLANSNEQTPSSSPEQTALTLSQLAQIQPTAAIGICGLTNSDKISYNAPAAAGSSGAPVFGPAGTVIAINTAQLKNFPAANFAAPIQHANHLRHCTKSPAHADND